MAGAGEWTRRRNGKKLKARMMSTHPDTYPKHAVLGAFYSLFKVVDFSILRLSLLNLEIRHLF